MATNLRRPRPAYLRALIISVAALLVPVCGSLLAPNALGPYGALLWLLALVPAFLLAYHRVWRGVATALALGMVTLSSTQVAAALLGRETPSLLPAVVIAYLVIALGVGWLAELLHRDRDEVEDMAFTDLLTHLPNRRHARLFLDNEFAAAERGRTLSLVLFDLDHFKAYNDRFGHGAGDAALRVFAEILARTTRRMDLSGRFGGEEFLSVLTSTDTEGALIFADRIRAALASSRLSRGSLTVSAGAATYHPTMRSPDELLAAADDALYQAKREGRNRVRLFGRQGLDHVFPSPDAQPALQEIRAHRDAVAEYPRADEEVGRTRPPMTLLPHQITRFGSGRRALLVEDDSQVRAVVSDYLSREGFLVTEAGDVPTGVAALGTEFDIVITDIRLPGVSGYEMVRAVKSRWPATQVLVITGLQDAGVAAEALAAGADRYLFKPFGMPELRHQLVGALARRERMLQARRHRHALSGAERIRAREARDAVLRGVDSLVRAVETRDPFTRGHAARVALYSLCIAEALDPEGLLLDRESLEIACRLHDLGKIGVPDTILNKEAGLTPDEEALVRTHPSLGRRVLEPLLDDDTVLDVVMWHHERWDGSGYPDGLSGAAIPLTARIVAYADALDAMTSGRAHRRPLAWDDSWEELLREAGRRFDPEVVEAAGLVRRRLLAIHRGDADEPYDAD